jgi:hypothetical protein
MLRIGKSAKERAEAEQMAEAVVSTTARSPAGLTGKEMLLEGPAIPACVVSRFRMIVQITHDDIPDLLMCYLGV